MWFTEYGGNAIGRLDPRSGAVVVDPLPSPGSGPRGIAVGPGGTLWFAEADGNRIGQYLILSFAPQQVLATGSVPIGVAVADFN
ncbi:MAG: hypothetical protein WKF75_00655, partial [Singulisphaera sp.]